MYPGDPPISVAGTTYAQDTPSTRKGLPWSGEEVRLLVKLRDEQKMAWPEATEQFVLEFPGRKGPYKCTGVQHSMKNGRLYPFFLIEIMDAQLFRTSGELKAT
jgi:hypothetical protein